LGIGTWCGKSHATSKAIFGHFTVVAAIYDSIAAVDSADCRVAVECLMLLLLLLLLLKLPLSSAPLSGSVCCPNLILIIGLISYIIQLLLALWDAIQFVVVLVELL